MSNSERKGSFSVENVIDAGNEKQMDRKVFIFHLSRFFLAFCLYHEVVFSVLYPNLACKQK